MSAWFEQLKSIVNRHEPEADEHALARAGAVVLLEMAAVNDQFDEAELEVIHQGVERSFGLEGAELEALIQEAKTLRRQAVSLHDYTRALRTGLKRDCRDELVEWLWKVAYADGRIDRFEEQLLRRLADLLGVPHEEFIRRKHMAGESR